MTIENEIKIKHKSEQRPRGWRRRVEAVGRRRHDDEIVIHVDGATGGGMGRWTGAGAVARTADGQFCGWLSEQMPSMTNNEAEYKAVLLGLRLASVLGLRRVVLVSDSETVVRQMQGRSRVISGRLKVLHKETVTETRYFEEVVFRHVLREGNRLADALANEALEGKTVTMEKAGKSGKSRKRWKGRGRWGGV